MSIIRESVFTLYNDPSVNVTPFDQLREQYAEACPQHSYKTCIFSMDSLITYLEDYIPRQREHILKIAEPEYTPSQVAEPAADDKVRGLVSSERLSLTAYFYDDPVTHCIKERSASFQGNVPVDRIEDLQAVQYTVGDQFRQHWDWWEGAENRCVSTFFAYLARDSD